MARQDCKHIIAIDACNIRNSGGLRHLIELLNNSAKYENIIFEKIIVWSSISTLNQISDYPFLEKKTHKLLNINTGISFLFQIFFLKSELKSNNCNIVLVPGGIFLSSFKPFVTISQNLLPFEFKEAFRYKKIQTKIKFILIRVLQVFSFNRSSGVIFLSNYARNIILNQANISNSTVINHGIDKNWFAVPSIQLEKEEYSNNNKFKFLYVSNITAYKHQWNVAQAVIELYNEGFPISLTLIGPSDSDGFDKLLSVLNSNSNSGECIEYLGNVDYSDLYKFYESSDAFVFASTCENMPLILLEAMAVGLPILCSIKGPMHEFLQDNQGFYFDPENIFQLKEKIKELFLNKDLRKLMSEKSFELSKQYSWDKTTFETLTYLHRFYDGQTI